MRRTESRFVFDTNVLVSALLFPKSSAGLAVEKGFLRGTILVSADVLEELSRVLDKKRFDKYLPISMRQAFFLQYETLAEFIDVTETIPLCRDSSDDKFIALAITGKADVIITGDTDLLVLHPFKNIRIITPAQFV